MMDVTFGVETVPTSTLCAEVERLHRQLFPSQTAWSADRFASIMSDPAHRLVTARRGGVLIGMASLILVRSFSRTAVLFEEFVVDESERGRGIGKAIDRFILDVVREQTDATRIEGTVNEANSNTWHVHMASGFSDRKNRTIIAVVRRQAAVDATKADLPPEPTE